MTYQAIAENTGVQKKTVQSICNAMSSRQLVNNLNIKDKRGKASKVTPKHIREIEKIFEEDKFCAQALTFYQLLFKIGL